MLLRLRRGKLRKNICIISILLKLCSSHLITTYIRSGPYCSVVVMQRKPGEGRFTFLYQIGACSEEIQSRLGTPHQDLLASISEGLPALWPVDVSSAARLNTSTYCQRRLVEEVMARKRLVSTGQRA